MAHPPRRLPRRREGGLLRPHGRGGDGTAPGRRARRPRGDGVDGEGVVMRVRTFVVTSRAPPSPLYSGERGGVRGWLRDLDSTFGVRCSSPCPREMRTP